MPFTNIKAEDEGDLPIPLAARAATQFEALISYCVAGQVDNVLAKLPPC